jgi:hypothetical protein
MDRPRPRVGTSKNQGFWYPYLPLQFDNQEIRILVVQPTKDGNSDIYYSLEHVSLTELGAFIALLYHWGDSTKLSGISTDFSKVPVTNNLHRALRAILTSQHELLNDKGQPI